jgi:hypothetical protein
MTAEWLPIDTAPEDGTLVWVYTRERNTLPAFECPCAYHPDAGWCTDELREVTHWMPLLDGIRRLRDRLAKVKKLAERTIDTGGREELHPVDVLATCDPTGPYGDEPEPT